MLKFLRMMRNSKHQESILKTILHLLEKLPVELVGFNVLGYLSVKDIVMLERACGSKKSQKLFLSLIPYCPPLVLPSCKQTTALAWFAQRLCKIAALTIFIPAGNHTCLRVKNLLVNYFDLEINYGFRMEYFAPWLNSSVGSKVRNIYITQFHHQNREAMEQLSACTGNVKQLTISYSDYITEWLTTDVLTKWKLREVEIFGSDITSSLVATIAQTCTELTSIKLKSVSINDAAVIAIAQHCPKLETLLLETTNLTWTSLLALSERGLPLKTLHLSYIPSIPTADITKRCSYVLSRICYLSTYYLHRNRQDANILIAYVTGLTRVCLRYSGENYIPLLAQHCSKLTYIEVFGSDYTVADILSLCRANPSLQELYGTGRFRITDTALIELIHACPHLHTLCLPFATDITDIGILALSEHCHQLQRLVIQKCEQVTEVAVLQLLQRCRKLTRLVVSSSSLSEETWTQLDKNTQKRVSRCYR